jgi:endonuclease/exonuclease/phosphatase family metal-dependent hydrolase
MSGSPEFPPLRVLTLNAHQGFNAARRHAILPRLREALRSTRADLVFLQEIGVARGTGVPAVQYEILADTVWPQHAYGRNAVASGGHHGNALLSKHPIASWRNIDVSPRRAEARGMLHCTLGCPGLAELHAVCVHLSLRESQRRRQVGRLLALVTQEIPRTAPLVVAGDFNDWSERAHARLSAECGLEEIHASARGRPARTFPALYPVLRLDRIYVRNLRHRPASLPRRPWSGLSDHVPLAGEISGSAIADAWEGP